MTRRRSSIVRIACVLSVLTASVLMGRSDAHAAEPLAELSPRLDPAIDKGLAFLAGQQKPDGTIESGQYRLATTGLSLIAFLSAGQTPGQGKYGANVTAAIDCLVKVAPANGYFGSIDTGRMYGHGIITLALAEAYGVERGKDRRDALRKVLDRAVKVILDAQAVKKDAVHAGGWRYEPGSPDSDLSLSGWNALALRAASNLGINVPKDRAEKARAYVLKCYHENQKGFSYQPGNETALAMTGVGVLNLFLLDAADSPQAIAGAKTIGEKFVSGKTEYPYYSVYYTTQAAYQAGDTIWPAVWKVTQQLIDQQQPDGGWPQSRSNEEPGRVYATSMAVMSLTVPYRLLPVYQR